MKNEFITEIMQKMLHCLNNNQAEQLRKALEHSLFDYELNRKQTINDEDLYETNQKYLELFLSAKHIEGCSDKTLKYYRATVETLFLKVCKNVKFITTDDLRSYLTDHQNEKGASRVTIDNIRRILSTFFGWLEDEDYIIKSPVRRIHKVKTGTNIKETYSDEALELMRDEFKTNQFLSPRERGS